MRRTRDIGPYSNYRLTVRLELANKPGIFAKVAALLAEEQANLGAVDLVSATKTRMIRDITFNVQNEEHGEKVLARLDELPERHRALSIRSDFSPPSWRQNSGREQVSYQYQKCALHGVYPGSWSCFSSNCEG